MKPVKVCIQRAFSLLKPFSSVLTVFRHVSESKYFSVQFFFRDFSMHSSTREEACFPIEEMFFWTSSVCGFSLIFRSRFQYTMSGWAESTPERKAHIERVRQAVQLAVQERGFAARRHAEQLRNPQLISHQHDAMLQHCIDLLLTVRRIIVCFPGNCVTQDIMKMSQNVWKLHLK